MTVQIATVGGGVMAEAILSRLIEQNTYAADAILVSEPSPQRRSHWQHVYGVAVTADNREVLAASAVLLAVKPQVLDEVAAGLAGQFGDRRRLAISILAGVPISRLQAAFPGQAIVRVMPNTNATVGASVSAIAVGEGVQPEQVQVAKEVLAAVGEVVEVPEYLLDAVTGLSGSGPAYVALMVEALADGGVAAGLPRAIALELAIQTVLGTAKQLQETGIHPAQLKDRVTSPGGTTIAGVAALERNGFRSAVIQAVQAAWMRSRELGQ